MQLSTIKVIPQKEKDPLTLSNHRPIPIQNCGAKKGVRTKEQTSWDRQEAV